MQQANDPAAARPLPMETVLAAVLAYAGNRYTRDQQYIVESEEDLDLALERLDALCGGTEAQADQYHDPLAGDPRFWSPRVKRLIRKTINWYVLALRAFQVRFNLASAGALRESLQVFRRVQGGVGWLAREQRQLKSEVQALRQQVESLQEALRRQDAEKR